MIDIVRLGSGNLTSSRLALGCMGMSEFYVGANEPECASTIAEAIARGVTMFDTADMYGPFANELFLGRCLRSHRHAIAIATKFGYVRKSDGTRLGLSGRPDYVKLACDASLRRLGTDYIDLYYLHRVDRTVPVEDTVGAMSDLVRHGKVRFLGLSEVSCATLRRAHAAFPISAVQTEYSLVTRDPERALFDTLKELNIGFVAYAPLGRGLLTGRFQSINDIPKDDYRRETPRFLPDNLKHNASLVQHLMPISYELGVTPAQLALAWVREKIGDGVILCGTTNRQRLIENIAALDIGIPQQHFATLSAIFHHDAALGTRYPDMSRIDG